MNPHLAGRRAFGKLVRAVRRGRTLPDVLPLWRQVLLASVDVFNGSYSPRCLVRLRTEVVPTHPRDVSAVRARMGTLIELFLAVIWNNFIGSSGWRVSVNYVTEYPNLFLRDGDGDIYLRIETKALHDEA